ncbi:WD40-repeat-containing domain protein [Lanmaoa asiatica]|nr:WD40-repeat-containing domain protein [Lanmaoa asiatica]
MMTELSPSIEIDVGNPILAVTFTEDGKYLVSGGNRGVRVWRVEDGKRIATMEVGIVNCLAVSQDGRWIAAGTWFDGVILWDAKTYEQVFSLKEDTSDICGVDFSPDSTRLVVASDSRTATIWDLATRERVVGPLCHEGYVRAAKYSLQGDRIATATPNSVRVYDSNDGSLLVDVSVNVAPRYNSGLLWSNDQLFIVSDSKIKLLEASTGSVVSEWPVPGTNDLSCIALPQNGEFIAYSVKRTVMFWDMSTHTYRGLIQPIQDVCSISLSPDDRFLAIGGVGGKITIKTVGDVLLPSYSSVSFIDISDTALDAWKQNRLTDTEASLTGTIANSRHPSCHALANRALVRAHLRDWDTAIDDAEKASLQCFLPTRLCPLQNYT